MAAAISPQQLAELHAAGRPLTLIDVRTPVEYREAHVEFARNVPLDRLTPDLARQSGAAPLYVICQSGGRGRQACEQLAAAGLDAINVEGGTRAWSGAGLPVVRGKKAISLERQVRITAGALVLASSLLALAVHPYFAGVAAFVGAGLVFAGVTDTCGMGLLLAKMPWNQAGAELHPTAGACRLK